MIVSSIHKKQMEVKSKDKILRKIFTDTPPMLDICASACYNI